MIIKTDIYFLTDIEKSTAPALREFVSFVELQIGALKNLKQPVVAWNMFLVCMLSRKVDQYTNRAYHIDR